MPKSKSRQTSQRVGARPQQHMHADLRLPKFWRPKVSAAVQSTSKIAHWDMITAFVNGTANSITLQEWIDTGFTYAQMMHLLHADGTQFTDEAEGALANQIEIYKAVGDRYRQTGRVAFSGPELVIARAAAEVMDSLIEMDRYGIALKAAIWTTKQSMRLARLRSQGAL